jgi:hypothetical protein
MPQPAPVVGTLDNRHIRYTEVLDDDSDRKPRKHKESSGFPVLGIVFLVLAFGIVVAGAVAILIERYDYNPASSPATEQANIDVLHISAIK